MGKVDCLVCGHWSHAFGCGYQFRRAANAGGATAECSEDVCFCLDFEREGTEDAEDK